MEENPIEEKNPIEYTKDIYYFNSDFSGVDCEYPSPNKFGESLADFMKLKQVHQEISSITPVTCQGDTVGYWVILKDKKTK